MISTSLNHCKEMGAEPGRRSLKMPAEKLGPVIVAYTECGLNISWSKSKSGAILPLPNMESSKNVKDILKRLCKTIYCSLIVWLVCSENDGKVLSSS